MLPRRTACTAGALAVLLLTTACSDDGPAVEDFTVGVCRDAAPDVLELRDVVGDLGDDARLPDEDKQALRDAQGRLNQTVQDATGEGIEQLTALVEAVGLLRIRADGNTYDPVLADDVRAAHDRVVAACTQPGGG